MGKALKSSGKVLRSSSLSNSPPQIAGLEREFNCRLRPAPAAIAHGWPLLTLLFACLAASPLLAASTICPGSKAVAQFKILLAPAGSGKPIPLESVNAVAVGNWLEYEPSPTSKGYGGKAKVAIILLPAANADGRVTVLKIEPADSSGLWRVPFRSSVVAVVLGPSGLSVKKVRSFVRKNPDLMPKLADYAERSSTIEALVQTLAKYQQSKPGTANLQSVLNSFSAQYGVTLPALASSQSSSEQANALLHALLPAISSTTPLDSRESLLKGSTGLAASVASMFFGSPVGLATGGAMVFEDLRESLFPSTAFRAAFAQLSPVDGLTLCGNPPSGKGNDHVAYLWVHRIPDADPPTLTLVHPQRLPLGWASTIQVTTAKVSQLKLVPRARDWRLVSVASHASIPVRVAVGSAADRLALNLSRAKLAPGSYHLAAKWDWTPLPVTGDITLVAFPDLSTAAITSNSNDRLLQGTGMRKVRLSGADFEFVDRAHLVPAGDPGGPITPLIFVLGDAGRTGKRPDLILNLNCDLLTPGKYWVRLQQRNGAVHDVPLTIHHSDPTVMNLPLKLNIGEARQTVILKGAGLERIQRITSGEAIWTLAPAPSGASNLTEREAVIALAPGARQGKTLSASVFVDGLHQPLSLSDAIRVIGPLPKIVSAQKAFSDASGVELGTGEIPAESAGSFLLTTQHAGSHPTLLVRCGGDEGDAPSAVLALGAHRGTLQFDSTGADSYFLSLDPASTARSGCSLTAAIENPDTGVSAPYSLGRVVLLPQIDSFTLTGKKAGPHTYVGTLTGRNLQVIAQTGWDADHGHPTLGIPTPLASDPRRQSLQIGMPWPPPAPHAPLYIWLEGETKGRSTSVTY